MNNLVRFRTAPITTAEAKLNLFAPVDKILDQSRYQIYNTVYEDDRFKVSISGTRLTQIHRDILDIALFHGSYKLEEEVIQNIPVRTFSLYQIQKHLQHKNKHSNKWLIEKFQEIKRATIAIRSKKREEEIEFNIIRIAKRSDKLQEFVLVFEELYFDFFENSISIDYKELLPDILSLKHAQTKAVVRYMLSHKNGHQINIDKLFHKLGFQGGERNIRYYRKIVIEELEEVGEKFNIQLTKTTDNQRQKSDYVVKYLKHEKVKLYHPNQPSLF